MAAVRKDIDFHDLSFHMVYDCLEQWNRIHVPDPNSGYSVRKGEEKDNGQIVMQNLPPS